MRRIDPEDNQATWIRDDRARVPGVETLFDEPDRDRTDAERAERVRAYAEGEVEAPDLDGPDGERRALLIEAIHTAQRGYAASAFEEYDAPPDVAFPTGGLVPGDRVVYLDADRRVREGEVVGVDGQGAVTVERADRRVSVAAEDVLERADG